MSILRVKSSTSHISWTGLFRNLLRIYLDGDKMSGIKLYRSIVIEQIFHEFKEQRGISLFNHSSNSNNIEDFISTAYVLCPNIIEINGYIFIG
ncbi:hypothetical protein SAMN02744124_01587 [Paenibacillus barengoltzii J12]|jgi:hypothetical protein|uniref:Transposase DDE domain-containing protein n=1 Tax=Paenibacillus barengoltzii J12 TaxID=935846 RepID=A0ABY1LVV6_9BACL|nr:hypothetical protein SAMN02744124_01587 [Paenibacillus barengoltzii J12]SMF70677.1 hypothetical protein SAMN02744102_04561 [Paenibacillus barengoltzii]